MTDREIYEGIRRDDRRVLAQVYKQFYRSIHRYVLENGGRDEDALDVFQDSVVALYLNVQRGKYEVREGGRLGSYVQAIGKNVWRAKRRKMGKIPVVALEAGLLPAEQEPEDDLLVDRMEELKTAFDELGDQCRRLLRLFYYEKLSLQRIAALMTFTEKTAKNNKYRCMQTLRKKLKPTND